MFNRRTIAILALLALVSNTIALASPVLTAEPEGRAFSLLSLRTEQAGERTRILIESNAPPLYTVFRPTGRLIQIEMPGAESSKLSTDYPVRSALVESVAVRQGKPGSGLGRLATRIEIAVREGARDVTRVEGNTLVVEVSTAAGDNKNTAAAQAKQVGQQVTGVSITPPPVAAKSNSTDRAKPQPAVTKPATLVRSVRHQAIGNALRVVIDTDGAAQFKDFVLADPWRVVVDITGVRLTTGNQTINVGAASVDRFRIGQPSPGTVRIVLDTRSKLPYRVERDGTQLVITIGNAGAFVNKPADGVAQKDPNAASQPAASQPAASQPEVKVAGQRVTNPDPPASKPAVKTNLPAPPAANLTAQSDKPAQPAQQPQRLNPQQPSGSQTPPAASRPTSPVKETLTQPVQPTVTRVAYDAPRVNQPSVPPSVSSANQSNQVKKEMAFCDPSYVGGLISFDLRAGVDIRDMLRFVSQQYGVNFIIDSSIPQSVPVDIRVTDLPWNQVINSVLRANRLGSVCESGGRMIRIATLSAIKEEEQKQGEITEEINKRTPLETKILKLRYARASGSLSSTGGGRSGGSSGGSSGGRSGGGLQGGGTLVQIAEKRLSPRGRIEADARTNSLIITDLPENIQAVESIIAVLDRPEPQVEIEARIVVANRDFLRDIGNELAGAAVNTNNGAIGFLQTGAAQLSGSGVSTPTGQGGGSSGGSGGSGDNAGGSANKGQIGPNLLGPFANNALRVGNASGVFSLTTGLIGSGIISYALSASERKGQVRIVASPRITTQDNQTAEIINGVQIPVQTVSNNTVTTTFITAALRLEITPQIIEETGEVQMHVVAENNTVNSALATQLNGGTPGINTQSAESTVRVQDGGTTVMGGINIDSESHTQNRMPGISRVPIIGELFKRRTTQRTMDEVLFFITPRIVRPDGSLGPRSLAPQRSATEPAPAKTTAPQRASSVPANAPKSSPANGKGGQ
jgi:type IV pilus assembly protein PilQ